MTGGATSTHANGFFGANRITSYNVCYTKLLREFLSARPFAKVTWARGVDARGRPIETPEADYRGADRDAAVLGDLAGDITDTLNVEVTMRNNFV